MKRGLYRYVEPFRRGSPMWRTDRMTCRKQ